MSNRAIETEIKVKALEQCLTLQNVEQVAAEVGVAPNSIRNWFNAKVLPTLPAILVNEIPGPKPRDPRASPAEPPGPMARVGHGTVEDRRPSECPQCHQGLVWKNGVYWVLNWLAVVTFHWFSPERVPVQRFRCAVCGCEIITPARARLAEARHQAWQLLKQLVAFSKFKLGLSDRRTVALAKLTWGWRISTTFVNDVAQSVGQKAQATLARLKDCRQKAAHILMGDETFPRIVDGQALRAKAHSVGVAMCESGLIRGVKAVRHQVRDMGALFKGVVGTGFQPEYFLSDFDVHFPKIVKQAISGIMLLKDFVHAQRVINRHFDEAVRNVTLEVPKGTSTKERNKQRDLKRRLLRKRLEPIRTLFIKAFRSGYEAVAFIYIEGALQMLQDPTCIIQTESVRRLHTQLTKFFTKHGKTLLFQFEQKATTGLVCTTNALESKNSLFKPFERIAQAFQSAESCEAFLSGLALMEDFDVKTRGSHQGTSAMQRAEINLADLGAHSFFEAVGLAL
jgi:hypothetical protein